MEEVVGTDGFATAESSMFDLFLFIGTRSVLGIVLTVVVATVLSLTLAIALAAVRATAGVGVMVVVLEVTIETGIDGSLVVTVASLVGAATRVDTMNLAGGV